MYEGVYFFLFYFLPFYLFIFFDIFHYCYCFLKHYCPFAGAAVAQRVEQVS